MADDIEADLAQLRAEIARFVLEAIAADPQGEMARAMGRGLQDAVGAQLSDTLPTLVSRAVASGWERSLPRLVAAAEQAGAVAGTGAPMPVVGDPAGDGRGPAPDRGARAALASGVTRWGVQGIGFIVGVAALFIAVAALALVFLLPPRGISTARTDRGEVSQTGDDGGAATTADAEVGWQRVLGQVATWPAAERRAALDALCGQGVSRDHCPTFESRRFVVSDARARATASAAVARAMSELGACAPASAEGSGAASPATNTATNSASAQGSGAASPGTDAVWDCLVYGAARG